MRSSMLLALALLAASCSAPEPHEEWAVQRVTPDEQVEEPEEAVCADIRAFALGPAGSDPSLDVTLDELGRIGAVMGATTALPALTRLRALDGDDLMDDDVKQVLRHDLLVDAATAIDDVTAAECELPAFSALYAASGFPECHFEMEIPVAAYTTVETEECRRAGRPSFLPCWTSEPAHLPIDCVNGAIVQAVGERWEAAGRPRQVAIDRSAVTVPENETRAVVRPVDAPECLALGTLFSADDLPNGSTPDHARLAAAVDDLDRDTQSLVDRFIDAASAPPGFEEFESLVAELDAVTALRCGVPLVSAWGSIVEPVDEMPCWVETGVPYPAFEQSECD